MSDTFRCHDADACKAGQAPCPMDFACGTKPVTFWGGVKKFFSEPGCCEINGVASCQQGRQCPKKEKQ